MKLFGSISNIGRRKLRRMSTFVCEKTRTVLGLQSTDGGDGYTCLFEDLGLR